MGISKKQISLVRSLVQKKYRQQHGLFVAEGEKLFNELVESDYEIEEVFATQDFETDYPVTIISEKELKQISGLKTPNKVVAIGRTQQQKTINYRENATIALHEINDPGNLGTIIRTADWFGIDQIVCSENSVDVYNPKVVQASMGSIFRVKVMYCDLEQELVKAKKDVPILAATMNGKLLSGTGIPMGCVLLFGSESHGLPGALLQLADKRLTIPGKGNAESLNVGVAVGIFCSELAGAITPQT